jgi:hypothetical protein
MPAPTAAGLNAYLETVVALGNRFPGTPGEARCRDFLLGELERLGLARVRAEEFPYLAYEPEASRCRVLGPGWEVPCVGVQGSAPGVAEGEAVFLGPGEPEDVERVERRVDLAGKIAVVQSFRLPLTAVGELAQRGVAGLVNVGEAPGGLVNHCVATFYPPALAPPWPGRVLPFPGVTIEAQAARRVLSELSTGTTRLRVEHGARYVEKRAANVLGELPGASPSERVVVGAHYDTQLDSPGANDNATGVAALLEIAARWRGIDPHRTIVFAAWAVEELGAWGSYTYTLAHGGTIAAVNLDSLGAPITSPRCAFVEPSIGGFARECARRVSWEVEVEVDASTIPFGDHTPFIEAGVPVCGFWRYPPPSPWAHTAGDVLERVDRGQMLGAATASAYAAFRLAHGPR